MLHTVSTIIKLLTESGRTMTVLYNSSAAMHQAYGIAAVQMADIGVAFDQAGLVEACFAASNPCSPWILFSSSGETPNT